MKNENSEDTKLRSLLREWEVDSAVPPRFEENVWRRIAAREAAAPNLLLWWRRFVEPLILRPAFATAFSAVLVAAGLLAGALHARAVSERTAESLGALYVQNVDPYQMPRP
ncbi:MAG TPA: hypothetical protein GYA07_11940 [Verrucomicrobia bacterium]|nr:hypothetical protein [Verrucomicrobiota bacterium]HOB31373.1 hypothetical protein [Verrucomicrobiota bacterium]HOP98337.1 hypothetical protein [Verrucomicrobiota bacterium]HPU55765.1 hypothetical protein [Verrucomicrobiota bacterium]